MTQQAAPDVVVIGAGVIGLSTAVCLAERGQRVEVRTRLAPAQTTSAVASAMIGPAMAPADDDVGRQERASIAQFISLAEVAGTGVTIRRGRLASREPVPALGDMTPCAAEELPPGFAAAFWATLPLVDMPVYLDYLTGRLVAAGGRIVLRDATAPPTLRARRLATDRPSASSEIEWSRWRSEPAAELLAQQAPALLVERAAVGAAGADTDGERPPSVVEVRVFRARGELSGLDLL